jgi:cytochrome c-type biogenesis protein CcmE
MTQKKTKFVIGSALIVVAIGYLITAGISSTSQYFFTVDELMSQKISYAGEGLKVKGNVVNGSIVRDSENYLKINFAIEDKSSNLNVTYEGIIPDMFKDGQEVVVEGTLAQDGVFHANTLLTSCPSKYEAEREAGKSHPGNIPYPDTEKEASPKSTGFLPKTTI